VQPRSTEPGAEAALAAADGWVPLQVLVVGLCFLLNMLDGADLLVMSFIAPVVADQWTVSPEHLGYLFSASLAGMAVGCVGIAPKADHYGRRGLILAGLALTAGAMLLSALSHNVAELIAARLLVGVGVGTIGVTMTTMAAEYAPRRHSSFAVGLVQAGWPLGSIITALACARLLPGTGWPLLLIGIGAVSTCLLLAVAALLPESISFLQLDRSPGGLSRINAIRHRLRLAPLAELPAVAEQGEPSPAALFTPGRAVPTALLWTAVTLSYFVLYFVISWIPRLVMQSGLPLAQSIYAGATFNLGAFIGTAAIGWVSARYRLTATVATWLATAAVVMVVFGGIPMPLVFTLLTAMTVGITVQGGFNGFWAVATRLYPAGIRNTGVGWVMGTGRVGAVLGPIAGGYLVGARVSMPVIFAIYALPLLIAAVLTTRIRLS